MEEASIVEPQYSDTTTSARGHVNSVGYSAGDLLIVGQLDHRFVLNRARAISLIRGCDRVTGDGSPRVRGRVVTRETLRTELTHHQTAQPETRLRAREPSTTRPPTISERFS